MPMPPKLYVNQPAQVMDNEIADRKDAKTTNIAPVLYHRIINVNPMQLNRADAEQILVAYTPYVSKVQNNITMPTIIMTLLSISATFRNVFKPFVLVLLVAIFQYEK